ncbi:hypothetical protein ANRL1_04809 [Anaerolineae bacterium]|nr:hypothetical protein ANRL1_04809 [Anaerolineae bacterium]
MLRNVGLSLMQQCGQVANTLLTLAQSVENLQTGWVRQCLQKPSGEAEGMHNLLSFKILNIA